KLKSTSIHAGRVIPSGAINSSYNSSYHVGLDVDYCFTENLSALGLLGYNHFVSGSSSVSDTYWWNISANLKYKFTTSALRPYINFGPGVYIPGSGSKKPGLNIGLGLDISLTSDWTIELGGDYHHVFTGGSDTSFFVPHIGLIYRL
ncbi:MAG: porin family protein, partial [Candidatus Aminicenantes bacterium]